MKYGRYKSLLESAGLDRASEKMSDARDLVAHLDRRLAAITAIRSTMTEFEASALGVDDQRRYLFEADSVPGDWVEYEVVGGSGGGTTQIHRSGHEPLGLDPLIELRLRAAGAIEPRERIVGWTVQYNAAGEVPHPLRQIVETLQNRGMSFNHGLPRVRVVPDEATLAEAVRNERAIRAALQEALFDAGMVEDPPDTNASLYIGLYEVSGGWARWWARTFLVNDNRRSVVVRVLADGLALPAARPTAAQLAPFGDVDPSLIRSSGNGIASAVVARLLGFEHEDIWIANPSSSTDART